jgi:hypothetical protein
VGKKSLGKLSSAMIGKKAGLTKEMKKDRHKLWAERIMCHRGKYTDIFICAYGNAHRVGDKVLKVGNLSAFKSTACSGCRPGDLLLGKASIKAKPECPSRSQCLLLDKIWLITDKSIKPGDLVTLPRSIPERNVKARMKNAVQSMSLGSFTTTATT